MFPLVLPTTQSSLPAAPRGEDSRCVGGRGTAAVPSAPVFVRLPQVVPTPAIHLTLLGVPLALDVGLHRMVLEVVATCFSPCTFFLPEGKVVVSDSARSPRRRQFAFVARPPPLLPAVLDRDLLHGRRFLHCHFHFDFDFGSTLELVRADPPRTPPFPSVLATRTRSPGFSKR